MSAIHLRADAPIFVPMSATNASALQRRRCEGDRLIQKLADQLAASSAKVLEVPRTPQPDVVPKRLLAAGLFCPACVQGETCAFHVPEACKDDSACNPGKTSAALLWLEQGAWSSDCKAVESDGTCSSTDVSTVEPPPSIEEDLEPALVITPQMSDFPLPYKSAVWRNAENPVQQPKLGTASAYQRPVSTGLNS
jgi:hypothetical protein